MERFSSPDYCVRRDDVAGTVWVSLDGGNLSVGLRPNVIERRGFEAVLEDTDARLSEPQLRVV